MKRALKTFHVAKSSETAAGFLQIIFVLAVIGGTLAITAALKFTADSGPALSNAPEQLVVDVMTAEPTSYTPSRVLTGQVETRADVVISPEVNGRVIAMHENLLPGGLIDAGETLFSLDPTDYEIALARARADVASADAELTQATADAGNFIRDWKRVYPNEEPPALVAKEPQIDALKARLSAAQASVRQAETNLDRTHVRATNAVRVVESRIELDQFVVAGGQYGSFYVRDALRIRTSVEPALVAKLSLKPGSNVQVTVEGSSADAFRSSVISVGASLDARTRLQPVIVAVPKDALIAPGTFVSVLAEGNTLQGVYRLPATALASRESVWRVEEAVLVNTPIDIVDVTSDAVIARAFDAKDGIVVSQVPTSFVERPVKIRNRHEGSVDGR